MSENWINHAMLTATTEKLTLRFKQPAGTSRGVLHSKNSWILKISDSNKPDIFGTGEISIIEGLSPEWNDVFETFVNEVALDIQSYAERPELLEEFPSIRFAVESALRDLTNGGNGVLFPSNFTGGKAGIRINGLIWMGTPEFMLEQIETKINTGYKCLKLKIGALDFDREIEILNSIRKRFTSDDLMLRVDANGAFTPEECEIKLKALATFNIHSIEQPIKSGNAEALRKICANSPIPVALDEELIGIYDPAKKSELIRFIQPQYLVLKPSLLGGFKTTQEWIDVAEKNRVKWWITSALESNIGLSAIAQFAFKVQKGQYQGLGTGQLYENNVPSSLVVEGDLLYLKAK